MEQQYLIDSNAVIDYLSGLLPKSGMELMNKAVNDYPKISVITKIEVLSYNTTESASKLLNDFIDNCISLDLSEEIISETITLRKSQKIKTPDAIIASTALAYRLTLISRNENDFKNIEGLKIINPWKL